MISARFNNRILLIGKEFIK